MSEPSGPVVRSVRPPPLPPEVPGRISSPAQRLESDNRRFALIEDAVYTWWHPLREPEPARTLYRVVVPEGFDHDFASVPRILWALIAPLDLGLGSIFHDWLYRNGGRVPTLRWDARAGGWETVHEPWTRVLADELFARIMREQGVPRWRRRCAYLAVRVAGFGYWRACVRARST